MSRSAGPGHEPALFSPLVGDYYWHARRASFERLRRGQPASAVDVATDIGMTLDKLDPVLDRLVAVGLLERDDDGTIVGAQGLTTRPTVHEVILDGVALHTWCALDAIGIPAALDVNATITTRCGWCQQPLHVRVVAGRPVERDDVMQWLPDSACDNVRQQFCPAANLFCNRRHLHRWHSDAGRPSGRALTLAETATLGRQWWGTGSRCCPPTEAPSS